MTAAPSRLRGALVLLLEVGVVSYIVGYLWSRREDLAGILEVGPEHVGFLVGLVSVGMLVRTKTFLVVLRQLRSAMGFGEAFALTVGTSLLNYLPLNPGMIVRARVLKAHRALSYPRYVSLMTALLLLRLVACGGVGLAILLTTVEVSADAGRFLLGALFVGAGLGPVVVLYTPARLLGGRSWVARKLREVLEGWREVRADRGALTGLVGLSTASLLLDAARLYVCFHALQLEAGPAAALFVTAGISIVTAVNLTPAGVGVRELFVALLADQLGLDFATGMLAAGLDRVAQLITVVLAGGGGLLYLKREGLLGPRLPPDEEASGPQP